MNNAALMTIPFCLQTAEKVLYWQRTLSRNGRREQFILMTKLQEALTKALKHLGVPISIALPTLLCLETEEEQLELAQYLRENLERKPSVGEIEAKVREILNSAP